MLDDADSESFRYRGEVTDDMLNSEVFRGAPETMQVEVIEEPEAPLDWPTIECGDAGPAPKAEVEYGATAGVDEIDFQAYCGPVTATDP